MKKLVKKIFLILVFLLLNGVLLYSANAETQNINVQLIVPSSGGGGGGDVTPPPVVDATPPTISGVVSSTTHTTALISWTASDNVGISSVAFAYGTSLSYGLTASPAGSYSVNLSGLATGTIYYFKITAVDASSNSVNFTGSFKTTEASIVLDVTPPTISNVASSTTYTTASINWSASDNKAISATTFVYGTTISYGQTSIPGGSYVVNLSGLATNTVYYFKITAIDTSNNQSTFTGSFKTPIYTSVVSGPIISNISAVPGVNSAVITFNTDKNSTAQINYGSTVSLGSNASQGQTPQTSHTLSLFDLSPNKTYYYQIIATDADLISTSTIILNFKTLPDIIAPPNVSNLQLITGLNSFTLNWNNPSLSFAPDFSGVKILRKINVQASGPNDNSASVVYSGNGETVKDSQALPGFTYFYTVYSYDASNNFSSGNFVQGKILVVVSEICNDNIDNNNDGKTDCADQTCTSNVNCIAIPQQLENCNNSIDDNSDGKIDCADSTCNNSSNCKKVDEVLNNTAGAMVACSDTKDNDNDGMIDFPTDIGCSSSQDSDEYNPPTSTVPEFEKLTLNKLKFFAGSRQIELTPQGKTIIGLANSNLSVGIKKSALIGDPKNLILRIGDIDQHQFNFDSSNNTYYADVLFPQNGTSQAFIEINYGANQIDSLGIDLQSVAMGQIMDDKKDGLIGAEVTLHSENGGDFTASVFGQKNPQITNFNSLVGWMVPNGRYYITVKKDKFYDYSGPFFNVSNNIINNSVNLVAIPPKIQDVIDPKATVAKNVANVANNIAQKTSVAAAVAVQQVENAVVAVQEIASDPEVQKVARTVVAPTAVGVAAVSSVALASWADIIPLLRFLFLQPLLVLGRGKREKWGMVYNSLSKLPVDLALVRLFNMDTGKLVQTKVTSSDGKYFFTVNAGRYRLEVRKGAFVFPTIILKGFEMDGKRVDIYHGEAIKVVEKGSVITANIPLDPAGEKLKTPFRLIFGKMIRRLQNAISWIGLVVTLVTLYISPVWYMWLLLCIHISLTLVFWRLSKPPIAKGWGIVYDEQTKKPLSKVIARLFDSKFNKLVATEVTGPDGKYYFMAGDNQYYISYDRDGYNSLKTEIIDLKGKDFETIAQDIKLKKK
ncbi:MAG: hypothetical protein ACD_72C00190G0002 [uncultured bacterium]|nr:MAG: hypothetical protein ACD_72C00190G0002 [uncultured bacterium]